MTPYLTMKYYECTEFYLSKDLCYENDQLPIDSLRLAGIGCWPWMKDLSRGVLIYLKINVPSETKNVNISAVWISLKHIWIPVWHIHTSMFAILKLLSVYQKLIEKSLEPLGVQSSLGNKTMLRAGARRKMGCDIHAFFPIPSRWFETVLQVNCRNLEAKTMLPVFWFEFSSKLETPNKSVSAAPSVIFSHLDGFEDALFNNA